MWLRRSLHCVVYKRHCLQAVVSTRNQIRNSQTFTPIPLYRCLDSRLQSVSGETLPPNLLLMPTHPLPKVDRQREHQANERTFLAWLRTSIALIGFGFAIARFGIFLRQLNIAINHEEMSLSPVFNSQSLGLCLVVVGVLAMVLAAWRYNQVFWQIEHNSYRPSRLAVWIMTAVTIVLGLLSIPLLLFDQQKPPSNPTLQPQSRLQLSHFIARKYSNLK